MMPREVENLKSFYHIWEAGHFIQQKNCVHESDAKTTQTLGDYIIAADRAGRFKEQQTTRLNVTLIRSGEYIPRGGHAVELKAIVEVTKIDGNLRIRYLDSSNKEIYPAVTYSESAGSYFTVDGAEEKLSLKCPYRIHASNPMDKGAVFQLGPNQMKGISELIKSINDKKPSRLGTFGPASGKSWLAFFTLTMGNKQGVCSVPKSDSANQIADEFKTILGGFKDNTAHICVLKSSRDRKLLETDFKPADAGQQTSIKYFNRDDFEFIIQKAKEARKNNDRFFIIIPRTDPLHDDFLRYLKAHPITQDVQERIVIDEVHQNITKKQLAEMTGIGNVFAVTGTPSSEALDVLGPSMVDINTYDAIHVGKVRRPVFHQDTASDAYVAKQAIANMLGNISFDKHKVSISELIAKGLEQAKNSGEIDDAKKAFIVATEAMKLLEPSLEYQYKAKGFILVDDPEVMKRCACLLDRIEGYHTKDNQGDKYLESKIKMPDAKLEEFAHDILRKRQEQKDAIFKYLYTKACEEILNSKEPVSPSKHRTHETLAKNRATVMKMVHDFAEEREKQDEKLATTTLVRKTSREFQSLTQLREELNDVRKSHIAFTINAMILSTFFDKKAKDIYPDLYESKGNSISFKDHALRKQKITLAFMDKEKKKESEETEAAQKIRRKNTLKALINKHFDKFKNLTEAEQDFFINSVYQVMENHEGELVENIQETTKSYLDLRSLKTPVANISKDEHVTHIPQEEEGVPVVLDVPKATGQNQETVRAAEKSRDQATARLDLGLSPFLISGQELAAGFDSPTVTQSVVIASNRSSASPMFVTQAQGRDKRVGDFAIAFSSFIQGVHGAFNPRDAASPDFIASYEKEMQALQDDKVRKGLFEARKASLEGKKLFDRSPLELDTQKIKTLIKELKGHILCIPSIEDEKDKKAIESQHEAFKKTYDELVKLSQQAHMGWDSYFAEDADRDNLLHLAVKAGHVPYVELLIEAGMRPSVKNKDGKSAIDLANELGRFHLVGYMETLELKQLRRESKGKSK